MNKIFLSLTLVALIYSCDNSSSGHISKKEGKITSSAAAGSVTDEELEKQLKELEKEEQERLKKEAASKTTLKFDRVYHDFGNVGPNSDNVTEFKVTNTGKLPLIIEDVAASCGCTTPKRPENPILPGQSDVIEVKFSPKPGQQNEIIKTVTVTSNTVNKIDMLEIRAFVTK